jgi:Uma2 family endonuclease
MLPAEVKRHRFTVQEYHAMAETGLLSEDDRVELVDGEIVEMTPIGTRHLACVVTLNHLLVEAAGGRYFVSVQNPIVLDDGNEPQPDLSLLKSKPDPAGELPGPADVLLVVEVSDSTLSYDRGVKLPRYGRAGIPEVWIVDLAARQVEMYSDPSFEGYRTTRTFGVGEQVRSATASLELPAGEIFS